MVQRPEVGIVQHTDVLVQDDVRGEEVERALFPPIDDPGDPAVRSQVAADDDVGIENDPHDGSKCRSRMRQIC